MSQEGYDTGALQENDQKIVNRNEKKNEVGPSRDPQELHKYLMYLSLDFQPVCAYGSEELKG